MLSARAERVRQALGARGLTPASAAAEPSRGRADDAVIAPAELIEDPVLRSHAVGRAEPWPGVVAFLDGTRHSEIVGYAGASPIVVGEVAAAVRERVDRVLRTAASERRPVAIGREAALTAAGDALAGLDLIATSDDEAPHPVRDLHAAARALERARVALEVAVGAGYRERSDAWLLVDGSLSENPRWAGDARTVGIARSHATLPFDGEELERYLRLPAGERSSVYAPRSRRVAPVRAWALRLWPWQGKDLFHGLIRVEVAPVNGTAEMADRLSRWLLAERAPLSTPDPRWDRLLYGIHSVEACLKAGA